MIFNIYKVLFVVVLLQELSNNRNNSIPDEESEGVESDAGDTDNNFTRTTIQAHSSGGMAPPEPPKKRLRTNAQLDKTNSEVSQAIQKLDQIAHKVTEDKQYEQFGKYVAAELRQLPKREAILLQQEIQSSITRSKLNALDNEQVFEEYTFDQAFTPTNSSTNEEDDVLQTAIVKTFGKPN